MNELISNTNDHIAELKRLIEMLDVCERVAQELDHEP